MGDANPYEAPAIPGEPAAGVAAPVPGGISSGGSPAGSQIQIGPRNAFDEKWMQRGQRIRIIMLVPFVVVVTQLLPPVVSLEGILLQFGQILALALVFSLILPIYQGQPRWAAARPGSWRRRATASWWT